MRISSVIAAALIAACAAFADADAAASSPVAAKIKKADSVQAAEMKKILLKLVRQDEYLDETIETVESLNGKLSLHDISALGLNLKLIKNALNAISAMNKTEFPKIRPEPGVAVYTKTMLSYSRSVSRKITKINGLVAAATLKNKKPAMRDAVSSKKSGKTGNGKKLTQILEEQKAMKILMSDIQLLNASSRKLTAVSKWLYIVSK